MPITDNFNRADGGLGAGWEHVAGGSAMVINSNAAQAGASFQRETMRRSEASFPADHYSQAECSFTTGAESAQTGVTVRTDGSGNCYYLSLDTGGCALRKIVAGSDTFITDYVSAHTASVFYTMRLTVIGDEITIHEDTVLKLTTNDSSLTTGRPGIFADGNLDKPDLDDFESTDALSEEGGYYLLENGTDRYQLEDSSGLLTMEGDFPAGGDPFPAGYGRNWQNTLIRM